MDSVLIKCLLLALAFISLITDCLAGGAPKIYPQKCFQCNYYEGTATDPNLQTALQTIEKFYAPTIRQCMYDYKANKHHQIDTSSLPSITCSTANLTQLSAALGVSFNGFKCASIYTSFSLVDMNTGLYGTKMSVTGVARGCVPYQAQNPYAFNKCFDATDTKNPYVQWYMSMFNSLTLNHGVLLDPTSVSGHFCLCSQRVNCNTASGVAASFTLLMASFGLLKYIL